MIVRRRFVGGIAEMRQDTKTQLLVGMKQSRAFRRFVAGDFRNKFLIAQKLFQIPAQRFPRAGTGAVAEDSLTVSNSTFSDNGGLTSAGGAIFASAGAPVHLTNNTFSGNLASAGKGGAVSLDTATTASTATITNSILAGAGTGLECAGAKLDKSIANRCQNAP